MYQFCCYDYVEPEYGENAKLFYMKTGSFIVHVKANGNSKDNAEDVEGRLDTSNLEIERLLPKWKIKN